MAEANILGLQDRFTCSVCLDLIKEPVALLCGHSFCMVCINDCWDQEDQKGVYSCPQCRQTFTSRPAVSKNTMLAEIVETLKKTELQATRPVHCSAGPEDVECDSCTGTKSRAIKSCLVCLASFCETHLQPHYQSPAFKKHKLVEASRRLQEQICSQHDKLLEVYCRTDQKCICMLCTMDEHKGHDTVSASAGQTEKQKELLEMQAKSKQRIQEIEIELQELSKAVETHKQSAQATVQETERIFNELIKSIEKRRLDVTKRIRAHEKAAVSQAEEVLMKLEQELAELKRKDAAIEKISPTEDPIYFLQSLQPLVTPPGSGLSTVKINSLLFFDVLMTVSQLKQKLEACSEFRKISREVNNVRICPPQSREEFLSNSCKFTLDPNTANPHLQLSDLNRTATAQDVQLKNIFDSFEKKGNKPTFDNQFIFSGSYTNPESFDCHPQVLCKEYVCGPCYWEVEWSQGISIAVSYKDINRKGSGNDSAFGRNDKSWALVCSSSSCTFLHNNQNTHITVKATSSKIGVFLDPRTGILCFFSVSDKLQLLHRVHTTFTQPLYPGFKLNNSSKVKLCY